MHVKRGLLVMLASSVFFAGMSTAIRKLSLDSPHISAYTVAAVRFFVGGAFVVGAFTAGVSKLRWVNRRWIVARGVMGGIGIILHYWAIHALGLAKAGLYAYTSPIFAALLAVAILGERLSVTQWISIAFAVLGMTFVTGIADLSFSLNDLIGLSVGVTWAAAIVALTKCRETDTSMNIFLSQCLFGLAFALWPSAHTWVRPTWGEAGMLLLIAALSIGGQLAMTSAYKYTGATYGSLLGFFSVILTTIIAVAAFQEKLSSRFWLGAVLIVVPCVYLSVKPVRRPPVAGAEGG